MATVIYSVASSLQDAADTIGEVLIANGAQANHIAPVRCVVKRPKRDEYLLQISEGHVVKIGTTERIATQTLAGMLYGIKLGAGKI